MRHWNIMSPITAKLNKHQILNTLKQNNMAQVTVKFETTTTPLAAAWFAKWMETEGFVAFCKSWATNYNEPLLMDVNVELSSDGKHTVTIQ